LMRSILGRCLLSLSRFQNCSIRSRTGGGHGDHIIAKHGRRA
jgi:hypothetical protein